MNAVQASLLCTCGACRLPYAHIVAGELHIQSDHRGQKHVNRIPLASLTALAPRLDQEQLTGRVQTSE